MKNPAVMRTLEEAKGLLELARDDCGEAPRGLLNDAVEKLLQAVEEIRSAVEMLAEEKTR